MIYSFRFYSLFFTVVFVNDLNVILSVALSDCIWLNKGTGQ